MNASSPCLLVKARVGRHLRTQALLALGLVAGSGAAAEPADIGSGLRLPRTLLAAGGAPVPATEPAAKGGIDSLLADDNLEEAPAPTTRFFGFDQLEAAYTYPSPGHWSKLTNRIELGAQGGFSENIKWKISGRFDYGAIHSLSNFYPEAVRDDQRYNGQFRETFVDFGAGDVDLRLGRQQIIWGEVIGLFVADVVSAKDLRESLVMDFDLLRIPQWAARAEYFKNDIHVEAIWIPFPTVNRIGRPGSEFYPYPPPPPPNTAYVINNERKPAEDGLEQNYGLRGSILRGGWDVAGFAYRSVDASPSFFRQEVAGPIPALVYTPRHEKITQYGSTVSKDFDDFLFKAEAVYTVGQNFSTTNLADGDGVTAQNYLDYIVSVEVPLPDDARFNAQFFQRIYKHHDADIYPKRVESGATLFWSGKLGRSWEPQILAIHSLDHNDWLLRPKMVYNFAKNWRAVAGVDIFGGHPTGLFGQYDRKDRVYSEVRFNF